MFREAGDAVDGLDGSAAATATAGDLEAVGVQDAADLIDQSHAHPRDLELLVDEDEDVLHPLGGLFVFDPGIRVGLEREERVPQIRLTR